MRAIKVSVSVVNGKDIVDAKDLSAVKSGKPVRIKAIDGGKYVLSEGEKGFAPENITIKRVGKDLHVALEGTSPDAPELIIEGFYEHEGELVGMAEDSTYYEYVAVDGDDEHAVAFLMDGASSAQALGGPELVGFSDGLVALAGVALLSALALGGLGLIGAGLIIGKPDKGGKDDTTPPKNPGIDNVLDDKGAITGSVPNGGLTDDDTPTLSGGGMTPGDKVIISDNGETIGEAIVDGKGNWSFTPETGLNDGKHDLSIVVVDPKGNASQPSPPHMIIVDTTPPANPGIGSVTDDKGSTTGEVPNGGVTDDDTPTLGGSGLTPGDKVVVIDNGTAIGEVIVDGDGNWTFTPETGLSDGEHELVIVIIDPVGNDSEPSPPHLIIVDTTPPVNPGIGSVTDDKGSITGEVPNGGVTDDDTPTLSGSGLTPGDKVEILDNGTAIGEVVVDENGNWNYTPETGLGDGEHDLSIVITDPAGNVSESSPPHVIIVDTTPPVPPSVSDAVLLDDVGPIQGPIKNGDRTDDNTPTFQGKTEPNTTVVIYDKGVEIGRVPSDAAGNWSFTPSPALEDGQHSLNYVVVDKAGGESAPSPVTDFTVDTIAPIKPTIDSVYDDQGDVQGNLAHGATTDDAQPTISGTAEPGTTVTIRDKGVEIGRAPVNASGEWSFIPSLPMGNGGHSLTATATDAAGNVSETSNSFDFILLGDDKPAAPSITAVMDDVGAIQGNIQKNALTDDARPTVEGTSSPGHTITLYSNGKVLGTAVADATGYWSFTPQADLAEGLNNLSATTTNSAGNISVPTGLYPIVVDTVAPAIPGASDAELLDDVGAIQGPIKSGDTTDDSQPTFKGKTEPNGTVVIYDEGKEIGRVPSDAQGNWSFTPTTPLADGKHSLDYAVTDAAGNVGEKGPVIDFTVDTSTVAITIESVMDDFGSVQGQISKGGVTDDTTPTVQGKATANSTVNVYDKGVLLGSTTSDASGNWSFTPATPLTQGAHELSATVSTTAGGESAPTAIFDLTIDTSAPNKPTIDAVSDDVGTIQGPISNGGFTDDTTPTLSGKAEAGSTVHLFDKGSLLGSAIVDGNGHWSFTPTTPLNGGEHTFTVTSEDKSGNVSEPSDSFVVTIDTVAPNKPTIETVYDDQGNVQGNLTQGDITDDAKPTISGKAEAGSTVVIYDQGVRLGTAYANPQGTWTFEPPLPLGNGAHTLTVVAVDAAGNSSEASDEFGFVVTGDGMPAAPAINTITDDVGAVQGSIQKGGVTDDARPTIDGTAQAGSTVSLYSNGKLLGTVVADSKGAWSFTPTTDLVDGLHNFSATATNSAGNISPSTGLYPIKVDTVAPGQASGDLDDNVGAIQGPIVSGDVTDDNTPTFHGQAEGNGTVIIYDNGVEIGRVPSDAQGNWSFTPSKPLAEGPHSLNTVVVDPAGNLGEKSPVIDFVVDTSTVAITIESVMDDFGSVQGQISKGGVTDDTTPTVQGKATANSTVNVYDKGVLLGSTQSDSSGNWSFTPATALAEGAHNLTATVVTAAGGESAPTSIFDLAIDTSAPNKPTIDAVSDDVGSIQGPISNGGFTDDTTPTLSGKAEAGSTVHLFDKGSLLGSAVVDGNGLWSFTPTTPLNSGEHTFTVTSEDKSGNVSDPSDSFGITIDTVAPTKPTIETVYDDQGDITGNLTQGQTTDDAKPTISGKAEANSTVVIYDQGMKLGTAQTDASGVWTFEPVLPLGSGTHKITVEAVDAAGNTSPGSDAFEFVLLVGSPPAPAIEAVKDDVGAIQGDLQKNAITDDARPTIVGSGEVGATISIYSNGKLLGTTQVGGDGKWAFTPDADLADGLNNFTATATNGAGNISPETGAFPIVIDTTAPAAPGASDAELLDDVGAIQGPIKSGDTTDDSQPTFKGKTEPNGTVVIYDDGKEVGRVPSDAQGNWSFTPTTPLADGKHSLDYAVTDAAGNVGEKSPVIDFIVDTSKNEITIESVMDNEGAITGAISKGGVTDDTTPTVQGKATANSTVNVYDKGVLLGSTQSDAIGNWTFTPSTALTEGSHELTATVTTVANGESAPTAIFDLTIDTSAPTKPTIDAVSDDVGTIQGPISNGGFTDDTTPTLSGKAEAGSTVHIFDKGSLLGSAVVDGNGLWSFTPTTPLNSGEHTFTVTSEDKSGNVSDPSDSFGITIDTVAPTKPTIETVYDDQGAVQGNLVQGEITDDAKPTISGKAEANSTVVIYDHGIRLGTAQTDASGVWTFEPVLPLGGGAHKLTVEAVDAAGNTSPRSDTFDFIVDGDKPVVPSITAVKDDVGAIQGNLQKNAITDDARPTIEGTAAVGHTVSVYSNGNLLGTVVADANGNWSFTPDADLTDGQHKITASATNLAGNSSPETGEYPIVIDTHAPDKPSLSDAELLDDVGTIQGPIKSGDTTDDSQPTFNGKAEPNATVIIYDDGKEIGRVPTDAQGNWTFTPTTPLADGQHTLDYAVMDTAGNMGDKGPVIDFIVDTSAVAVTIDRALDDAGKIQGAITKGGVTDDTTPTVQGKATANSTVNVYDKDVLLGSTTSDASGNWSFTPGTPLTQGVHELTATVITVANGESAKTSIFDLTIDTTAPGQPSIEDVEDDVGAIQGPIVNGGFTDDTTPTLSGRGEAGSTVHLYDQGSLLGSVVVDGNGNWSFTPTTPLVEGEHEFSVVSEDKAGNLSDPSDPFDVTIDTTAPGKPAIDTVYDDVGQSQGNLSSGDATDDGKPTISGVAEANSTVVIYDKGVEIGRAPVNGNGDWSFTPNQLLSNGGHDLSVKAVDSAGNTSAESDHFDLVVNTSGDDFPDRLGVGTAPVSVTFIADISGSMGGLGITQLKSSLTAMINAYVKTGMSTTFNLITFDTNATNRGNFSFSSAADPDYTRLLNVINGLQVTGNTNMSGALTLAQSLIKAEYLDVNRDPNTIKQVFILSDGAPNSPPNTTAWHAAMTNPDGKGTAFDPIPVISIGLGASANLNYLNQISSSGSTELALDPLGLENVVLNNMYVDKVTGNLLVNDVEVDIDGKEHLTQITLGKQVFHITEQNTLVVDNADGKTKSTYNATTGLLTIDTDAGRLSVYMFNSPGHKAGDYVFDAKINQVISATDSDVHLYEYVVKDATGKTQTSDLHIEIEVINPAAPGVKILEIGSMGKDTGASDYITNDGSSGRYVTGTLAGKLSDNLTLQVSVDGGKTWTNAVISGLKWAAMLFTDLGASVQARIVDSSGVAVLTTEKAVTLLADAPGAPKIARIPEAEGLYTSTLASNGSDVWVSLQDTGAKAGDSVRIQWGVTHQDQVLTQVDINAGMVIVAVPNNVTATRQGVAADFEVSAQIVSAAGIASKPSDSYHVVVPFATTTQADTLQKVPVSDEYLGLGFKVSTTGSMVHTVVTTTALAGLTLSDAVQANAVFTLDKPVSYFTFRVTGLENDLGGAQVYIYDTKGNLIEQQTLLGGTDARHTKVFTYTAPALVDVGSFKVVAADQNITLDAYSHRTANHVTDVRDVNTIAYWFDTFLGGATDDLVSLSMAPATYFGNVNGKALINGGEGLDTLKFTGANQILDLTVYRNKVQSIEIFDITGTGNNTLTLALQDVLNNGGVDLFHQGDKHTTQLMVKGNTGDKVNLSDKLDGMDFGDWAANGSITTGGVVYQVYQHSTLDAELLVQQGVTVTLV